MATVYTSWSSGFTPSGASQARRFRGGLNYYVSNNTDTSVTYIVNPGVLMDYPTNSDFYVTGSATGISSVQKVLELSYSYDIDENWFSGSDSELTSTYTKTHSTQTKTFTVTVKGKSVPSGSGWTNTTLTKSVTVTIPAKTKYTISFNANGGSGAPNSQDKWYGEALTLSSTKPTRTGYIFKHWSGSNGVTYQPGATIAANVNQAIILTAVWHQMPELTGSVTSAAPYYTPVSSYTYNVTGTTQYDDASVSSIVLAIGSQSISKTTSPFIGNYTISSLNASGVFIPTVTITDSQGGVQTYSLPSITVKAYSVPSVSYSLDRTNVNGEPVDEGTYAVLNNVNITFIDVIAKLSKPNVVVKDKDGDTCTSSVTWYSTRASSGVLSNVIVDADWENMTSPVVVYGLVSITGTFGVDSYQTIVTPEDELSAGISIMQTLPPAFFTIDFLAGGHGIAFGQPSTQNGFICNMDTTFNQDIRMELDDNAGSGTDYEILTALSNLGWDVSIT